LNVRRPIEGAVLQFRSRCDAFLVKKSAANSGIWITLPASLRVSDIHIAYSRLSNNIDMRYLSMVLVVRLKLGAGNLTMREVLPRLVRT
jgi:hypothetical protein